MRAIEGLLLGGLVACGGQVSGASDTAGSYERQDVEELPITAPGEVSMVELSCDSGGQALGGGCSIDARGVVLEQIPSALGWACTFRVAKDGAVATTTVRCGP